MRQGTCDSFTAILATLLVVLSTIVFAQCSAGPQRTEPPAAPAKAEPQPETQHTEEDRDGGRHRDEHEEEESARVKGVARVLKTIAADPEKSRTYGFPP